MAALLFISAGIIFFSPLGGNLWSMITEPAYFIPTESSAFTFRALEKNPGSGDWWVYGADGTNFYALDDSKCSGYRFISFDDASKLPDFDALDASTWD